jgi:ABC-type polysaccharide/polyol phosphate transport system ATPase subunit
MGTSIVFVSHNASLANSLADEAIVLDHGHAISTGSIEDGMDAYAKVTGIALK